MSLDVADNDEYSVGALSGRYVCSETAEQGAHGCDGEQRPGPGCRRLRAPFGYTGQVIVQMRI
jgi:hypothetical protein